MLAQLIEIKPGVPRKNKNLIINRAILLVIKIKKMWAQVIIPFPLSPYRESFKILRPFYELILYTYMHYYKQYSGYVSPIDVGSSGQLKFIC